MARDTQEGGTVRRRARKALEKRDPGACPMQPDFGRMGKSQELFPVLESFLSY